MEDRKIRVAITHGDTNGAGYELIFKLFADQALLDLCTPIIYGSPKVAAFHRNMLQTEANFSIITKAEDARDGRVNMLACVDEDVKVEMGTPTDISAKAALKALDCALTDYSQGLYDVLLTAPVCETAIQDKGLLFNGHTEYINKRMGNDTKGLRILMSQGIRVALLTDNIPVSEIAPTITEELFCNTVKTLHTSMKRDFRISNPRIATLTLNPHAGIDGRPGKEETEIITPAMAKLTAEGIQIFGPYAADDFFGKGMYKHFDSVLAMYHDQGSVPFRAIAGDNRTDYTAGLPIVRTAPDHTPLFDIAGKGVADEQGMRDALYAAIDIFRNRQEYDEPLENPLPKLYHEKKEDGEKVRFTIPKKRSATDENEDISTKNE